MRQPACLLLTALAFALPCTGQLINEVHTQPASHLGFDPNEDGVFDPSQDEFVELLPAGLAVDISGWTLSDLTGVRHVFPAGTILGPPVVVFGGGTPGGSFGGATVQVASSGSLDLDDALDALVLRDADGTRVASHEWTTDLCGIASQQRWPEATPGAAFSCHTTVSPGSWFSPGLHAFGFPYPLTVFFDLGGALAGSFGPPQLLAYGDLTPGSSGNLLMQPAAFPDSTAFVVVGAAAITAPFKGGVLVPHPDLILAVQLNQFGALDLGFAWPAGIPAGTPIWLQLWIPDAGGPAGFAASNALTAAAG